MSDPLANNPNSVEPELEAKIPGKNILHAPQEVTKPPSSPSWSTGTGSSGTYLTSANTSELTSMYNTLSDIYNALLKEGLIKPK